MDWLNFAATHGAKNRIRQWFKKHHREEHIQQGRQMLEAELGKSGLEDFLKSEVKLREVGRKLNVSDANDILAAIGYGDISTSVVVNKVREQEMQENIAKKGYPIPSQPSKPSNIGSLGGLLHHLAKCCQPVPGEEIVGVVTRGAGIAVHRSDCTNLLKVDADRRMAVDWSQERNSAYPAGLQVECLDRVGIAGDILKKLSDNKINLKDLRVETHKEKKTATIYLILDVLDIDQLTKVSQSIAQMSDVIRVQRRDHRKKPHNTPPKPDNVTPLRSKRTAH
jgi:GTP pyrophosphokinase